MNDYHKLHEEDERKVRQQLQGVLHLHIKKVEIDSFEGLYKVNVVANVIEANQEISFILNMVDI